MENSVAIWLGLFIILAVLGDVFLNDADALVFLGKELLKLIDLIKFWD